MIEAWWGLTRTPFANTPDPEFAHLSAAFDEGLARLLFDVTEIRGGLSLVTGEVGCGKTMLAATLADRLAGTPFAPVALPTPRLSPTQLLRAVGEATGSGKLPGAKHALVTSLGAHLRAVHEGGRRVVLIVDEAQLASPMLLEEIRLLTNYEDRRHKHLHLVLLGQPELRQRVAKRPQLDQRIGLRFHLAPLDAEEVPAYLAKRLEVAGANGERIFDDGAVAQLASRSGGVPRVINNLATQAMFVAAARKSRTVDGELVNDVADDRE